MKPEGVTSRRTASVSARDGADHPDQLFNALSVDVEDYFQVASLAKAVRREDWNDIEPRVERSTRRLLKLLARAGVRATMFVLGWVAERWPQLVREIVEAGHEAALHGYDHRSITSLSRKEFRSDIRTSKALVEEAAGTEVIGYRAPNYSIVKRTEWALEILAEEGIRYDSSIFPIRHDRYGIPDAPRFPWRIKTDNGSELIEFPMSTIRLAGLNFPFVGGGYLRHFPFAVCRWGIRHINEVEKQPAMVYIHPWEIDPDQPRIELPRLTALRHYRNLDRTEPRLEALLAEFRFTTVREVLGL